MNGWDRLGRWARLLADVALGVTFAAALVVQAVAIAVSWGGAYWLFGCAAGSVVCVLALVRRRHRGWTAVAGLAVAAVAVLVARFAELPREPSVVMGLALSVLVGSAVRTLPVRWAGAIVAGGFAVVAGSLFVSLPSSDVPAVTALDGVAWGVALVVGLGLRLLDTRRRAAVEEVRRDERLELARELHDVVAHHITGIVLETQAARLAVRKQPERLDDSLANIEAAGSDALAAMRRVVGLLRDADDGPSAVAAPERLSELVERFDGHGPAVHLRLEQDDAVWPPEVTSTVYRVVQESLTNIARHAPQARTVTVSVVQDRETVTVEVVDDAPPGRARYQHGGGYGLVGMRERVEAIGGTLRAGPRADAGWSVLATLPVTESEAR